MGKTYRRPAIKQHRELEEAKYRARVETNKKNENKNKHPKRELIMELPDWGQDRE